MRVFFAQLDRNSVSRAELASMESGKLETSKEELAKSCIFV